MDIINQSYMHNPLLSVLNAILITRKKVAKT